MHIADNIFLFSIVTFLSSGMLLSLLILLMLFGVGIPFILFNAVLYISSISGVTAFVSGIIFNQDL